jgi:NitT/TauT family transport system permease protein
MEQRPIIVGYGLPWIAKNRLAVVFGICFLAAWEILARLASKPTTFPPPSQVLWSLYARGDLIAYHAGLTFYQTILGFLISAIAGVMLGWMIGKSRRLYEAFYPMLVVLQVLPKEALAPLMILWFGAGILSRIILVFLISFFPVVINTVIGIRGVEENMRRYAASLSCPRWKMFLSVELPSALPSIFTGLKIAVTLSIVGAVVAEIVAGRDGLGYLLLFASSRLDMSFSLGILVVLAVWGALSFAAVEQGERLALYWR